MSDTPQGSNDARSFGPVIGFAIGTLVGGVLALLLAPASGEHTRRRIGNAALRLSRNARHTLDGVGEAASGLGSDVKAAITAGREAFQHDGEPHEVPGGPRSTRRHAAPPTRAL